MAFGRLSCWVVAWRGFATGDTTTMTFAALLGFIAAGIDRRLDEIADATAAISPRSGARLTRPTRLINRRRA